MSKMNESILSEQILEDMKENRIDHMKYLDDMEVLDSDVDKQVVEAMNAYDYNQYTAADVRRAIYKETEHRRILQHFCPRPALPLLEEMAQMARKKQENILETLL